MSLMEPFPDVGQWTFPSEIGQFTLIGRSRARSLTGFCIPEIGFVLDAGVVVATTKPSAVFVTHCHSDHSYQIPAYFSRVKPPTVFYPKVSEHFIVSYCKSSQELSTHAIFSDEVLEQRELNHRFVPMTIGEEKDMTIGGNNFVIDAVECVHSIPCYGYKFYSQRKKLKAKYAGVSGKELAALRKQGEEVSENVNLPMFAFLGDTTHQVFELHPELLDMPVVIVECTFLYPDDLPNAERTMHAHWDSLKPFIVSHPKTIFILIHFSLRYSEQAIFDFFEQQGVSNAVPFLTGFGPTKAKQQTKNLSSSPSAAATDE